MSVAQKKLTDWANEPSLSALQEDFRATKPSHDIQMGKIKEWLDLLNVEGPEKPRTRRTRSHVQPKLVRRQAEWRYSALSEPFLNTDKVFSITPKTFEDEQAAKQNALLLNWQFNTKLNKIKFIDDYVRAIVSEGTGIVKVSWVRETKPITKQEPVFQAVPVQDEQTMQMLQQAMQLAQADPRTYEETVPPEIKYGVQVSNEVSIPVIGQIIGYQEVPDEEIICNQPYVEVVNPANVYIDPSCNGDVGKAMFVIESFETSYSDLAKDGRYKNLEYINWDEVGNEDPNHVSNTPDEFNFQDKARRKAVAYEYWGYYDINGDGSLAPIVATWIKDVLIRLELNPYPDQKIPFVVVPYIPTLRGVYGEPDAELLGDNQRILGAVTRGMIDSLGRSANSQIGFAKGMLDPVNKRRFEQGEDYEFTPTINPQQGGLIEHKFPELPQSALLMVQMQNQEAEALTGVKAFSGGLAGDAYNTKVATAIRGVLDAASKREMAILRRLAKGMQEIGNKIIAMNAVFLSEKEVVRVTNRQYIEINKEDLKGNFDLEVDIATAEEDNAKSENLAFLLQTIGNNMDQSISMMILAEIADLKRMPALAEKLRTWQPDPVQTQMQQQMQQLQIENLALQNEKLKSEIMENQANAQKLGADAQTKAIDAQTKSVIAQATLPSQIQKTMADAKLTEAKAVKEDIEAQAKILDTQMDLDGTKHIRELQKMQAQARGLQDLEVLKALGKPKKVGESSPDIEAMIGFNHMTDVLENGGVY